MTKEMLTPNMQPAFDDMPELPIHQRMSVSRLLTPETYGSTEAEMMREQTPSRMIAAWPKNLYANLVGPAVIVNWGLEGPGHQAVAYGRGFSRTKIALAIKERRKYGYSFEGLGNNAILLAKDAEEGKFALLGDLEAPERAAVHAVEAKIEAMQEYREVLNLQGKVLRRFTEGLKPQNRGLARFGNEETAREAFDMLTNTIMKNMLEALADQRGWIPGQTKMARDSILARMLADRTKNQHLDYTFRLANMLLSYGQDKSNAFRYKIEKGQRYILDNGPKTIA
jgi:hypothetical protein